MATKVILIVASEPAPEKEEDYNRWYSGKHVPMMFAFKGMKKASRYKRTGQDLKSPKYLAIYEFESKEDLGAFTKSAELASAIKDFDEKWKDGGFEGKWGASYELLDSWQKQNVPAGE